MKLDSLDLTKYPCEYLDLRKEALFCTSIRTRENQTDTIIEETLETYFLRVFHHGRWLTTSFFQIEDLEGKIQELIRTGSVFHGIADKNFIHIPPYRESKIQYQNFHPSKTSLKTKKNLLEEWCESLKEYKNIASNTGMYRDWYVKREFLSSTGVWYEYDKTWSGIYIYYILKNQSNRFQSRYMKCLHDNNELKNYFDDLHTNIQEGHLFLDAESVSHGNFPVVLSPTVAGVFAHESFGHKSESDFMLNDPKLMDEWKLGIQVAHPKVSIIDDGNLDTTGYTPYDDDGVKAEKTYLIKEGILTGRLHNTETAFVLGENPTGNSRAISCEYEPLVRMTTTYFDKGTDTKESLIGEISHGYLINTYKHGSGNSTFTIAPERAYEIKNGKITKPVLISVVTGNVFKTLNLISGVSDKVEFQKNIFGGCGKMGQFPLPTSHGGPHLLVEELQIS